MSREQNSGLVTIIRQLMIPLKISRSWTNWERRQ